MDLGYVADLITAEETHYSAAVSADQLAQKLGELFNSLLLSNGRNYPIGSFCHSMLDEATFQSIKGVGWILADGRSVTGSQYETITGFSLAPDCRASAIRGKNNGVSTSYGNPSGDLAFNTFQGATQKLHSHDHSISTNLGSTTFTDAFGVTGFWPIPTQTGVSFSMSLGAPTALTPPSQYTPNILQVRSVVFNIFVRIN